MKAAVFTGSDLRSFGGGEKDIVGWANKVKGMDLSIYSFKDRSNIRMTYEEIRKLFNPDIEIVYYSAYKASFLRDLLPLTPSGIRALWSLRKFDTIYSMHQGLLINGIILTISKVFNLRFIFGVHSPIFFDDEPIENTVLKRFLMKSFSAYRDYLVVHTHNIRIQNRSDEQNILAKGFKGKIYNIPPHVYNENSPRNVQFNSSEFIALFVGRLSIRHKGLDLLEKIVNLTLSKNDRIIFHVVGSGPEGEPIIKRLLATYPNNFLWKGFLKEEDLEEEYEKANLFLFPSRGENFGISLGEAQFHGLPAVAFQVMGSEDVMTDEKQGVLVKPFDVEEFTKAILKYFDLWQKDQKGYTAQKLAISKIISDKYKDIFMIKALEKMLTGKGEVEN